MRTRVSVKYIVGLLFLLGMIPALSACGIGSATARIYAEVESFLGEYFPEMNVSEDRETEQLPPADATGNAAENSEKEEKPAAVETPAPADGEREEPTDGAGKQEEPAGDSLPPENAPEAPTEGPSELPPETPATNGEHYTFGTALMESEPVEDSYFDSAVFLGDSRTEGLQLFSGLKRGDYLWYRGAVTYIADNPQYAVFRTETGNATMLDALAQKLYSAVYIMTGVNELGSTAGGFRASLGKFLDSVLELQPQAVIYLQTIPPVNDAKVKASGQQAYITNSGIEVFNGIIAEIAVEKKVVLLDTAEVYRGENGQLPEELTSDGCHFKSKYYARWANYLRSHVMAPEIYHRSREQEQVI